MRLELHARTELTLELLNALDGGARLRSAELAESVGSTATYVAHLVAPLTRAGWVRSAPGPTGGYELAAALESHSLLELIELVEGPTDTQRCVMADRSCAATQPCALHDAWTRARSALTAELDATTIDQVPSVRDVTQAHTPERDDEPGRAHEGALR